MAMTLQDNQVPREVISQMASLILLIVLAVYCIWSFETHGKNAEKKIAGSARVALIRVLECADKSYFLPKLEEPFSQMEGYRFKALTRTVSCI